MSADENVTAPPQAPGLWTKAFAGDADALSELANRMWYPAYVWLRVAGCPPEDVPLHTIAFFSRIQCDTPPTKDDPVSARLREFLLARLKDFAAIGFPMSAGMAPLLMDAASAERRFTKEPTRSEDELFGRCWSLLLLELTLDTLRREYVSRGKPDLFDALKPFLGFNKNEENGYTEAAREVGLSASAFHVSVYHFRKRYREVLRGLIGDTVLNAEDVDSELTALLVSAS